MIWHLFLHVGKMFGVGNLNDDFAQRIEVKGFLHEAVEAVLPKGLGNINVAADGNNGDGLVDSFYQGQRA